MATIEFEVKTYKYSVYSQADTGLIWDNHHLKVRGLLVCEGADGSRAVIYGLADNSFIPVNRFQQETNRVFMFTRETQFEWYRDMLRNEKPVFCNADPQHPGWFTLTTGAEPVGEEES
ncbi:hypothetical protein [Haliangium ochraceum]|uniref:Uncharacterized protein n=1 Tax=Haliangium ochraceum (strain DSM 14365 / JCM 11303 / SMP-2) TaxID=502025 RepID=D0LWL6_HALO1|nr:hypothetical protein [Haliangium ochraceum]ACY17666.1 hypothetical protein Hoch_5178 [Haliangium ochraceum DSM 14365]